MKKIISLLVMVILLGGCASITGYRLPNNDVKSVGYIYVIHFSPDERHLERIIADELTSMGYKAAYGEEQNIPAEVNTIITYVDHWQWDITNYLIKFEIQFRNKQDNAWVASATSYRPSLQRRSPEEMIQETLNKILK